MEGATTLLSSNTHFAITSNDFLPQPYAPDPPGSTRKRKPIVTYQSPGSGVVDVGLLVRNTALEFEAAAVAAAIRGSSASVPVPAPTPTPVPATPAASVTDTAASDTTSSSLTPKSAPHTPRAHRPLTIPRPPRPLYHPLSRPGTAKPAPKTGTAAASASPQLAPPPAETGRRSSSRTRRPAPKVRDAEVAAAGAGRAAGEKASPARRRRGAAAGKRKRGGAQQEAEADGAYPAAKRARKPRERVEMEVDGEAMPPPTAGGTSPPSGYSTRAKRPRKTADTSSMSDGTGSVARTTPVNGHVEEFWVPIK